jgi:hypothetical protein
MLVAGLSGPATGASAAVTPSPGGSVGFRLMDAPADRSQDPRARVYIVDHLAPGTTIQRRVEVSNDTARSVHVPLYAGAASVEQGEFKAPGGSGGNELAGWVTLSPPAVDVVAHGTAQATATIAVPASASAGERYGVVWAELPTSQAGAVSLVNLVGVRMYLSIGPGGEPPSSFDIDSLVARRDPQGNPVVAVEVHNTGGRALDLSGQANLSGGLGHLSAGPYDVQTETLGIGEKRDVLVPLDPAIPSGSWDVQIHLHSGLVEHAAEGRLVVPPASGGAQAPVRAKPLEAGPGHLVPAVVVGVLVIAGVFFLLAWRRRRREETPLP